MGVHSIFIADRSTHARGTESFCKYPCRNIPLHSRGVCSSSAQESTLKVPEFSYQTVQWVEVTLHEPPWKQQNLALRYWFPNIYISLHHLSFLVNSLGLFIFLLILFISSLLSCLPHEPQNLHKLKMAISVFSLKKKNLFDIFLH